MAHDEDDEADEYDTFVRHAGRRRSEADPDESGGGGLGCGIVLGLVIVAVLVAAGPFISKYEDRRASSSLDERGLRMPIRRSLGKVRFEHLRPRAISAAPAATGSAGATPFACVEHVCVAQAAGVSAPYTSLADCLPRCVSSQAEVPPVNQAVQTRGAPRADAEATPTSSAAEPAPKPAAAPSVAPSRQRSPRLPRKAQRKAQRRRAAPVPAAPPPPPLRARRRPGSWPWATAA